MTFAGLKLSAPIELALKEKGFVKPTPIQLQAIPILMQGLDLIGQAQTGTGKTAAFGVPLLEFCKDKQGLQALVLVPTRELAVQVTQEMDEMAKHLSTRTVAVYGGASLEHQAHDIKQGANIVVGTPGRLIDHIRRGSLQLTKIKMLILDEADRMLDMGFIDDVEFILSKTPRDRQTALFSATMPQTILEMGRKHMHSPEHLRVSKDELTVKHTRQYFVSVDQRKKISMLLSFFASHKPTLTIVFCRTKHGADSLSRLLEGNNVRAIALHGNLTQSRRDNVMRQFKEGKIGVLVATDLAARGLDIDDVTHVVNFDLPDEPMTYVHRVGRTGRAGKEGDAITFVTNLLELKELRKMVDRAGARIDELKIEDTVKRVAPPAQQSQEHYNQRFQPRSRFQNAGSQNFRGNNRPFRHKFGNHKKRY